MDAREEAVAAARAAHHGQMGILGGRPVEAAIAAYEAKMAERGMVWVEKALALEVLDGSQSGAGMFQSEFACTDEHMDEYSKWTASNDAFSAMIEAASPAPSSKEAGK